MRKGLVMASPTFMERSTDHGVQGGEHGEGTVAKMIEEQTTKLPSDVFLLAAGGAMAGSLALHVMGDHKNSTFVGQWAPVFLILGLYNKLVKVWGSE
jgi:hypothetical protein